MNNACPISFRTLDETIVRLVALQVFTAAVIGCFVFLPWIAALLAIDFFIRAFTQLPVSYLAFSAKLVAKTFNLPSKPTNAGPKIFAARIGFFFSLTIAVLGFAGLMLPATIMAGMLAVFAALESFFKVCVGCHLYSLLNRG